MATPHFWERMNRKMAWRPRWLALFSGDRHAVNPQSGSSSRATKLQIVADLRDIVQHVFQVAGHGDLFHGIGEFAVLNPQAAGSAGKVAGDHIHAKTEELGNIKPALDAGDDLLRRALAFLQKEVS